MPRSYKKRLPKKRLTAEQKYQHLYWLKNRERILAARKKGKFRKELARYARDYYEENKEKLQRYQKKYRRKYYLEKGK